MDNNDVNEQALFKLIEFIESQVDIKTPVNSNDRIIKNNMNHHPSIAIGSTDDDNKIASLFFDFIFPIVSATPYKGEENGTFWKGNDANPVPEEVVIGGKNGILKYRPNLTQINKAVNIAESLDGNLNDNFKNEHIRSVRNNLSIDGYSSSPIFRDTSRFTTFCSYKANSSYLISIKRLPLINPKYLEWPHILDVRKDPDFSNKARKFRLFLLDTYEDKDPSYITDSLENKIYEYEKACAKHGLETKLSTLKISLDSKSFMASLGITAAALFTGENFLAATAFSTGAIIEVGKAAIHIAERKLSMETLNNDHEIAYLFNISNKLNNPNK